MEQVSDRAGNHLLIDLWGVDAALLGNEDFCKKSLEEAARAASATVLKSEFHHFGENFGLSGVVLLAESHISIHTWPERQLATIDVFMCGLCDPNNAIPKILEAFRPEDYEFQLYARGKKRLFD